MTSKSWTEGADASCVRKVMDVEAPREVAWRVFTEKMGTWWPLAMYKIGSAPAVDVVIEPRVGGRWYERGDDGSSCDWGSVAAWEPTTRLVLYWEISADWQHDPALKTEVEVRFVSTGPNATRVELEHRRFDLYGARAEEMRRIFDTEGDWGRLLGMFAASARA